MLDYESAKHIGEFRVVDPIPGKIMPGWIEIDIKHHSPDGQITHLRVNHMVLRSEDDSILQQAAEKIEDFQLNSKILPLPHRRAMRILVQGELFGDDNGQMYTLTTVDSAEEGEGDG